MNTNKDLGERIEKLVRELVEAHMKDTQATVLAAVTRGFGTPAASVRQPRASRTKTRSFNGRRSPEEVSAFAERLYELVCAKPGESMVTFSTEIGATARELHRPMATLKKSGRVRSVGPPSLLGDLSDLLVSPLRLRPEGGKLVAGR